MLGEWQEAVGRAASVLTCGAWQIAKTTPPITPSTFVVVCETILSSFTGWTGQAASAVALAATVTKWRQQEARWWADDSGRQEAG